MTIRILGINGSIVAGSTGDRALQFALAALRALGAETATFDISSLPHLDRRPDDQYPATVAAWRSACADANGFVIAAPSYHGAPPGALKNALDFVDVAQVGGKPFALIGIAGGDAEPVVADLARVMRYIGGVAGVPDVVVSRSSERWGKGEEPADAKVAEAIRKAAEGLAALCTLAAEGKLPRP